MTEVKILMVGPQNSGKTALANYIADAVQNAENPSQVCTPKCREHCHKLGQC